MASLHNILALCILHCCRRPMLALLGYGTLSGCAYRFTNAHLGAVSGMRSIAIEAIYDTSGEVIPHEVIWEALQRAFASDGHLRVVSRREADLLLRAHITSASITPSNPTEQGPEKDPDVFEGGAPPRPTEFKDLSRAREYATRENVSLSIQVDVWQLTTGKAILQKGYSGSEAFDSLRSGVPARYNYIRHDEALQHRVEIIANRIASTVVSDLMLSREFPQYISH